MAMGSATLWNVGGSGKEECQRRRRRFLVVVPSLRVPVVAVELCRSCWLFKPFPFPSDSSSSRSSPGNRSPMNQGQKLRKRFEQSMQFSGSVGFQEVGGRNAKP